METKSSKKVEKKKWKPGPGYFTHVTGKSMTIPGQALSIKTLMERIAAGMPVAELDKKGSYRDQQSLNFDSPDMEKSLQANMVEKMEAFENAQAILDAYSEWKRGAADRASKAAIEREEKAEREFNERLRRAKAKEREKEAPEK